MDSRATVNLIQVGQAETTYSTSPQAKAAAMRTFTLPFAAEYSAHLLAIKPASPFFAILSLGRANALAGNTAGERAAYEDFLTIWKDADPVIPILKQVKAEYAKLQ